MTRGLTLALAGILAFSSLGLAQQAVATDAAPIVLEVEPVFVQGADGVEPVDGATLYPGELLGLSLNWPDEQRRAQAVSLRAAEDQDPSAPRARRFVAADPRAQGRDVVEFLLVGVEEVELPSVAIVDARGETIATTAPFTLSVTPKLVDGQEPAPARDARSIGLDTLGITIIALVLLVLLIMALLAWRWLTKRPAKPAPAPPPVAIVPPDQVALRALDELLESGLLARDEIKPFGVRLAEIGKGYFGALAQRSLEESTTRECERILQATGLPFSRVRWLVEWLERIDLVKFAGDRPAADEMRELAQSLRGTIESTRDELSRSENEPRMEAVS